MSAFLETVRFELAYYRKRISTWLYFGIFFALGFLMINLIGGAWEGVQMAIGGSGGNTHVNSPYVTSAIISVLNVFGVLVTAALLGNSVFRDFEAGIHPLFYTAPITRFSYLGGRFTGALLVNAFVFLGIPLGLMSASAMPWLDRARFGTFHLATYLQPYLTLVLPTLLLTGAIFFALAALTRQMLPNYVGGAVMLVGYMLAGTLTRDLENERLAALLDPFGGNAWALVTKYWTPAEKNARLVGLEGIFLWNRLLWVAVGLGIFAFVFWRFRFSHAASGAGGRREKGQVEALAARPAHARPERLTLPAATQRFGAAASVKQYLSEVRRSFRGIIWNRYFVAIAGAGLLFLVVSAGQVGKLYGTTTWPVTYEVVELLGGTFSIFMLILISFYAGELIWRERDLKIDQVTDAMPVRTWVPFAGKLTALALMVALLQGLILVAGILTQVVKGYTNFELGLYLKALFALQLVDYLLLCALVMLVHVLVNHKYMGHLVVVLYFLATMFMGQMGLEHNLYQFGSDAGSTYSDMNGYGPFLAPFAWFKTYWAAWALLFAVLTNLLWVRGRESGRRWRIELARQRAGRPVLAAAGLALVLIVGLGGFIVYNTNVLNDFRTSKQGQRSAVEYERLYKRYEAIAQPRVVGVKVQADLYPERRDAVLSGEYRLVNRSTEPIDSVHVQIPRIAEIRRLDFSRSAERVLNDEERGYRIFRLAEPLAPGDSMRLDFELAYLTHGFKNKESGAGVAGNGTFINSGLMPSFGYDASRELSDDDTRRKYGLAPKERMAKQDDLKARQNTYISNDADWVDFEATVSTVPDQIAIAPGYLQKEWTEGGRRYFHYTMDAPILNFYSFLSARYQVKKDSWTGPDGQPVAIEIYYHPGHEYNLERMVEGVKKSLDYYTQNFGPYQHRQVRILEFPRYASFAQSFPNTIPYSEAIGFIARVEDPEKDIDYPFYVTAHEVAHQWWAHQVIGGNVQGATVLSETLSQYSALMVMEKEYGAKQMKRFLKYELDSYLSGRAFERKKEQPLALNENQQYIHYRKGSVAMYALKDYLGEERLNGAIAAFLRDKKFQQAPYTTSGEFVEYLRAATPDSLQGIITDMLETITLWDNRAKSAASRKLPDGRYEVTLQVEAHKVRADSLGNEHETPMNDLVDVGVYGAPAKGKKEGELLYLEKHRITAGAQQIRVVVGAEPARAGIDPLNKLIDRHSDDNVVKVVQGSGVGDRGSGGAGAES